MQMQALVSIHDLMPDTMGRVEAILDWLDELKVPPVTLLVVPGKAWTPEQIARLRELAEKGHQLAAHGWHHKTDPRKLYHRLHSLIISRDVAEHLDLDSLGVLGLLIRSGEWFAENDLPAPEFYVPPAWALGFIKKKHLVEAPYRMIETTRGIIHLDGGTCSRTSAPGQIIRQKFPLTGFEADTFLREAFLRRWNRMQTKKALRSRKPLRISIHPDDLQLGLADQMEELLRMNWEYLAYRDIKKATA